MLGNKIGEAGVSALCSSLKVNTALTSLDLGCEKVIQTKKRTKPPLSFFVHVKLKITNVTKKKKKKTATTTMMKMTMTIMMMMMTTTMMMTRTLMMVVIVNLSEQTIQHVLVDDISIFSHLDSITVI